MAGKNRFLYDKIVRDGTLTPIVSTDYHPSYTVDKIQNIWSDYPYRSKYGTNSGWGYFEITTSNQKLYFKDSGSTARTATIAAGNYDGDTLAAEIEARMEDQTTDEFTVTYLDASNKFQLVNETGVYELTCTTTTNAIWTDIGFSTASNKTGSATYIADYVRIHNYAAVVMLSGDASAVSVTGVAVFGLNLTSSYQKLQLDRWTGSAWEKVDDIEYDSVNGKGIVMFTSTSATKYRVLMRDWTNALGYVQVGAIVLGDFVEISTWYDYGYSEDIEDTSGHSYSKGGYLYVVEGFITEFKSVTYHVLSADETKLEDLYKEVGKIKPLVFVQDSDDAVNTFSYIIFRARFARKGRDAYTKQISLGWEEVK